MDTNTADNKLEFSTLVYHRVCQCLNIYVLFNVAGSEQNKMLPVSTYVVIAIKKKFHYKAYESFLGRTLTKTSNHVTQLANFSLMIISCN